MPEAIAGFGNWLAMRIEHQAAGSTHPILVEVHMKGARYKESVKSRISRNNGDKEDQGAGGQ
jgi:hypothetical protein